MLNKTRILNATQTAEEIVSPHLRYVIHIYNDGPGFLPRSTVNVSVPVLTLGMTPILDINSVEVATCQCFFCRLPGVFAKHIRMRGAGMKLFEVPKLRSHLTADDQFE